MSSMDNAVWKMNENQREQITAQSALIANLQKQLAAHVSDLEFTDSIPGSFLGELETLINRHSMESGSDTPDFILAKMLCGVLQAFDIATARRSKWYGSHRSPGGRDCTDDSALNFKVELAKARRESVPDEPPTHPGDREATLRTRTASLS
jgi:hypothetical protein